MPEADIPSARQLSAGDLSCRLEGSEVRRLSWQGIELLRGVSYLLRDAQWATVAAAVHGLNIEQSGDRFELHFELRWVLREGTLRADAHIEGDAQGHFVFSVQATSDAALRSNRCGFVVLHPADLAGAPLTVEHTSGAIEETCFPALISPSQPVFDIRRMRHQPRPGLTVDCRLDAELPGDPAGKFEMEDQRNWSDASFKTYVGSLLDPWPYELPAGRTLRQSVQVQVSGAVPRDDPQRRGARAPGLQVGSATGARMPAIGLGVPAGLEAIDAHERQAVAALRPAWLLAEIELDADALRTRLHDVRALAEACGAQVQLDLICPAALTPTDAAALLQRACRDEGWSPQALRACPAPYLKSYQPQAQWPVLPGLETYAQALRAAFPQARIGGGMFTYFTELNRKRPPIDGIEFIGHTTCPLVHAADDVSVLETLQSLPHIARSVQSIWPGLGHRLGPVTLAMHRNPYGDGPVPNPRHERIAMAAEDPRHHDAFGAAWFAGYAAAVIPFGLEVLSLNHSHGTSGPLLRRGRPGWRPGTRVPAWGVQQVLAHASGAELLSLDGLPEGLAGIAWQHPGGPPHVLLAHLGDGRCALALPGIWQVRRLGDGGDTRRVEGSLVLDAFEVLLLQR
jgi:hypothetical protein